MRTRASLACAAVLLAAVCTVATAAETFFGEDLNPGTQGEANPPLASHPKADAARAAFYAHLTSGVETEGFESIATGTMPPFQLTFGPDTATITGTASIDDATVDGHFAVAGSKFLDIGHDADPKSFHITFSTPQSAFGFYATDVGDGGAQIVLTFHHAAGADTELTVPSTLDAPSASVLYFGITDPDNPFDVVTMSRNPPTATDGFGFDEMVIARRAGVIPIVDAFFLPKKVLYKRNAVTPAKSVFTAVGFFDTGSSTPDLAAGATLTVGGVPFVVPALVEKPAGTFTAAQGGLRFAIVKNRSGSSRAKFKLRNVGDLGTAVPTDGSVELRFANAAVDGRCVVLLTKGGFRLGKTRGALVAPNLFVARARAAVPGGGKDTLSLVVGLATNGTTPATAADLHVEFGSALSTTLLAGTFTKAGDRFTAHGDPGGLAVTLDYARETISITGKGLDLGPFAQGANPLRVVVGLGGESRAVVVRAARKGNVLKY